MSDVEFRLEREDREGIVATGSYLADAIKRMGGSLEGPCGTAADQHQCAVRIVEGGEYLSAPTKTEREHLSTAGVPHDERLACQTKIERPGRVVVMTKEKKEEPVQEDHTESYKKEFAEMPLEKKIANLVQLEAMALGETISFVINSPFSLANKVMDLMADFGFKIERESKDARRPEEHKAATNGSPPDGQGDEETSATSETAADTEKEK